MRGVILLACIPWTCAEDTTNEEFDTLFHRAFREPLHHNAELDDTTFGKPGQLMHPLRTSVVLPSPTQVGLASRQAGRVTQAVLRGPKTPRAESDNAKKAALEEMMADPSMKQDVANAAKVAANKDMMAKINQLKDDPEFKEVFDEIQTGGMDAFKKYFSDKDFMVKLGKKFGDVPPDMIQSQAPANWTNLFSNPDVVKAAMSNPAIQEQMKAQQAMMQNPEMQARMKALQSDPEMKPMFDEMKEAMANGKDPTAVMQKYYNDPEMLTKISAKLGGVEGMKAAGMQVPGVTTPEAGAPEEFKPKAPEGVEPKDLFDAAQYDDPEAAKEFLEIGKDVNEMGASEQTPLHIAVAYNAQATAEVLIEAKANLDARDGQGMTPLHFAAGYGRAPLVELLLDKGADSTAKSQRGGQTAYEIATSNEQNPVCKQEALLARLKR